MLGNEKVLRVVCFRGWVWVGGNECQGDRRIMMVLHLVVSQYKVVVAPPVPVLGHCPIVFHYVETLNGSGFRPTIYTGFYSYPCFGALWVVGLLRQVPDSTTRNSWQQSL
eukprot:3792745-Rhodomonas_salina.1